MKYIACLLCFVTVLFIQGCYNNAGDYKGELAAISDSVSVTGLSGDSVKLVRKASIQFKVRDVEKSARSVSETARNMGGMIFDQQFEAVETGRKELRLGNDSLLVFTTLRPGVNITARIPSEHLETFLNNIADLGYFTSNSSLHIDDRSLAYLQNNLKEKARKEVLSHASKQVKKYEQNYYSVLLNDEAIDQQIGNRYIDAGVRYSTVDMFVYQNDVVRQEVVANYNIDRYNLPVGTQLLNAFNNGWLYFIEFVIALAHLWMFIVFLIGTIIAYRYRNRLKCAIFARKL